MSDPNKFINTYVDFALGTVHDYLNQILQLKTELKISNDLVAERNQVISSLENDKKNVDDATQNAQKWEEEVNVTRSKVAHMETLTNQYNTMRQEVITKDSQIANLNEQLNKVADYDQIKSELDDVKKKLERLNKKESKAEKKTSVVATKTDINKETTSLPVSKPVIVKDVKVEEQETDDF